MIKIGALWNKESKNGEQYLQGKFGDATLQVFSNNYKESENQPDFIVYLSETKKPEGGYQKKQYNAGGKPAGGFAKKSFSRPAPQGNPEDEDNPAL